MFLFVFMKNREIVRAIKQIAQSNYKLVLSQIFIIFFLWAVGVVTPYLSGLVGLSMKRYTVTQKKKSQGPV